MNDAIDDDPNLSDNEIDQEENLEIEDKGPEDDAEKVAQNMGVTLKKPEGEPEKKDAPADGQPAEKAEKPAAEQPKKKYADTFETPEDLENGYVNAAKKISSQGEELGKVREVNKRLTAMIHDDPEIAALVSKKFGVNLNPGNPANTEPGNKNEAPQIKSVDDIKKTVLETIDEVEATREEKRQEEERMSEMEVFLQNHPDEKEIYDGQEGYQIGALARNMSMLPKFKGVPFNQMLEKARSVVLGVTEVEAKEQGRKEAYAEIHTNNRASIPAGNPSSGGTNSGGEKSKYSQDQIETAKLMGIELK